MTAKELNSRTIKHLRVLAKRLNLENYSSLSKTELIKTILKKGNRKIRSAEKRIQDTGYEKLKTVVFFGRVINRNLLILLGLALAIYATYSLTKPKSIFENYYSELQFIGNVGFQIKNSSKNIEYPTSKDIEKTPLCGCKDEIPHYGISFFPYDYKIDFLNAENEIFYPNLSLLAPNHIIAKLSNERTEGDNIIYDGDYKPFGISFDIFTISQTELYLNEDNLKSLIYSLYSDDGRKREIIKESEGIIIKKNSSSIRIVSLDDVFMSSIDSPYGTLIDIKKEISNIQDKTLAYTIENDFTKIKKEKFWTPSIDVLGRANAFIFKNLIISDIKENTIYNSENNEHNYTILVAKSGFSQKIYPFQLDKNSINGLNINVKNAINNADYNNMLNLFEKRRNNFYSDRIYKDSIPFYLNPPFIQKKPNGVHFYGEFENLTSYETKGVIQLENLKKNLNYPKKINISKVDTLKLYKEPLVFQSNPNSNYKNEFMNSGNIFINEQLFSLNTFQKILSLLWSFLDSIIGFLGATLGLVKGTKGLTFSWKRNKTAYNNGYK